MLKKIPDISDVQHSPSEPVRMVLTFDYVAGRHLGQICHKLWSKGICFDLSAHSNKVVLTTFQFPGGLGILNHILDDVLPQSVDRWYIEYS